MEPFELHVGVAAPLLRDNIDTDTIIPSREMKRVSRQGLEDGLFANWRYRHLDDREPDPQFVLNQPGYAGASILLTGSNFGCGSSREHAVWALASFGIRAIVASGFGSIFRKNCVANGILPVTLSGAAILRIADHVCQDPRHHQLTIDLVGQQLRWGGERLGFDMPVSDRDRLLKGLDAIDSTLAFQRKVEAFEAAYFKRNPWARLAED